ncbi:Aste57867_14053 [Aphanomyces stellatus]|uniref:Aste57867_14053 protein n=1 Tax=Aphanomyces stellatus TaxID=120398 RepID=A0A485L0J1_9STRA|nr:hypothetical protein As57867_014002 [Aphanomyces stellatus]VFT90882.1 Aste57867_14053 [Aphanomyces stellatus]
MYKKKKRPSDEREATLYDWVQNASHPIDRAEMRQETLKLFRKLCLRFAKRFSPHENIGQNGSGNARRSKDTAINDDGDGVGDDGSDDDGTDGGGDNGNEDCEKESDDRVPHDFKSDGDDARHHENSDNNEGNGTRHHNNAGDNAMTTLRSTRMQRSTTMQRNTMLADIWGARIFRHEQSLGRNQKSRHTQIEASETERRLQHRRPQRIFELISSYQRDPASSKWTNLAKTTC